MPFPETPRVIYANNPLEEVICQLRFPTILEITATQPADFQKLIRHRYPEYTKSSTVVLPKDMAAVFGQLGLPVPGDHQVHKFTSEDGHTAIILAGDFVALTGTQYEKWELFREDILLLQRALEQIYAPSFYSRTGLRYKNRIVRSRLSLLNVEWSELLRAPFGSFLREPYLKDRIKDLKSNILVETDPGGCFVRILHGLDIQDNEETYVIDADFYTESKRTGGDIQGVLNRFNRHTGNLFRWAISETLAVGLGTRPDE